MVFNIFGTYLKNDGTIITFFKTTEQVDIKDYGYERGSQEYIAHLEYLANTFPNLIHRTEEKLQVK